ncbi:MAG: HigA family addiction module antitoxin [Planctomycetota bacterium]
MRATTHPGEVLREEFMKPLGLTPDLLTVALRVDAALIHDLALEKRAMTPDIALRLAMHFGTSAEFWTRLQRQRDVQTHREGI